MFEAFSRSWEITKATFGVINKDRELVLYPLFAAILTFGFWVVMLIPIVLNYFSGDSAFNSAVDIVLVFVAYLGFAFISTFFSVAVVYTAKKRFEGGNATFFESIGFSFKRIMSIFLWSMVSATVGLIMNVIDRIARRLGGIGAIVLLIFNWVFGLIWSIATIFVVQGIVYYELGPFAAIGKSVQTLKKTWGESLIRVVGLGFVEFVFVFLGMILFIGLLFVFSMVHPLLVFVLIVLASIYFVSVFFIFEIANKIFNTALFVYAETGKVPTGFNAETLAKAFKSKKK